MGAAADLPLILRRWEHNIKKIKDLHKKFQKRLAF